MENTTMKLWEIKNFQSSSVKALFVGQTANGQDCIACAWNSSELYVFAYEGIVSLFILRLIIQEHRQQVTLTGHYLHS